jgi:hypothetical protein
LLQMQPIWPPEQQAIEEYPFCPPSQAAAPEVPAPVGQHVTPAAAGPEQSPWQHSAALQQKFPQHGLWLAVFLQQPAAPQQASSVAQQTSSLQHVSPVAQGGL